MHVTFALLFLSWFFNVITCVDVLPARKRSFHDIAVQQAGRGLIKWDPRIGASRYSRHITLLKSLTVELEGPGMINSVEELTLTTIITNTGSKPLILVNEPSGALYSRRPTKRFYVTHSTGTIPQFKGVQVKYSIRKAIELGDVTSLDPGQSISVRHDLSKSYRFPVFGRYSVEPRNRFFVVNPVTKKVTMAQAGSTHGISVEWSGQLVARGPVVALPKFTGSFAKKQKKSLETDTQSLVEHVEAALNILAQQDKNALDHYVRWFGQSNDERRIAVRDTLKRILEFAHYDIDYHCKLTPCLEEGASFIVKDGVGICPSFFDFKGKNAELALISGWRHCNLFPKLDDHAIGIEACKTLAVDKPDDAVKNANSFIYFIMKEQFTSPLEGSQQAKPRPEDSEKSKP